MNELIRLYEAVFIPAWKESHTEGEPPCFDEWKNNDFKEWLEEYANNKDFEWQARMINNYAQDVNSNIPVFHDLDTLNDYYFTDIYGKIDHDNFYTYHDIYWTNICGYIRSGDYCDYVNEYWNNNILDYIINEFDTFVKFRDIDPDEYEY